MVKVSPSEGVSDPSVPHTGEDPKQVLSGVGQRLTLGDLLRSL